MTQFSVDITQNLGQLYIGDKDEAYKNVVTDAATKVLQSKFPKLSTSFPNSANAIKIAFKKLNDNVVVAAAAAATAATAARRSLADAIATETTSSAHPHLRSLGQCGCGSSTDINGGCTLPSTCLVGVTYKVTVFAEALGAETPDLAKTAMLDAINDACVDFSFQLYMKASSYAQNIPAGSNGFSKVQAQYAATAGAVYSVAYKRSMSPTPAPTPIPPPTSEPIVATKGTGLAILVSFLGAFALAIVCVSAYWIKKTAERKIKESKRLAKLDKWNKLPRNETHDKDPEFFDIYGGYSGVRGKEDPAAAGGAAGDDGGHSWNDWVKNYDQQSGRAYWVNRSTQKTTFRKPVLLRNKTSPARSKSPRSKSRDDDDFDEDENEDEYDEHKELGERAGWGGAGSGGSPMDDDFGSPTAGSKAKSKKRGGADAPVLKKGLSVPVRVRQTLDFQSNYRNDRGPGVNASSDFFKPPLMPKDRVKEAASVPDKNLWFERYSKRHNKVYWKHQVTNEVTWRPPSELDYYKPQQTRLPVHDPDADSDPEPDDHHQWTQKYSKKFGLPFWKNTQTGEVRWENPVEQTAAAAAAAAQAQAQAGSVYLPPKSPSAVETDHPPPSPSHGGGGSSSARDRGHVEVWVEKHSTEHGLPYFKNVTSGTITWDRPEGPGVQIIDYSAFKLQRRRAAGETPSTAGRLKTRLDLDF